MLIDENDLDIVCAQTHHGEVDWDAYASVAPDLAPVMPYINAVIRKPLYYPDLPAVTWRHEDKWVAVRSHEIAVSDIPDNKAAAVEINKIVSFINDLWERRNEIEPDDIPRRPPPLMSVLRMLPMNNCGECSLPTCTAFAAALINGEKAIDECPALGTEEGLKKAESLRKMGIT
ncbi:MAG: hypothetical protein JXA49_02370 [Actinobacteria bacterium]|nr:hypothetical protein [Actinomycetota bacterium]